MGAGAGGLPVGDADDDVNGLNDVVGGNGAEDPNEASEDENTLTNVDGQGMNLGGLQRLQQLLPQAAHLPQQLVVVSVAAALIPGLMAGPLAGAAAFLVASVGEAEGMNLYQQFVNIGNDPFDPNYTQVFTPVFPTNPQVPAIPPSASLSQAAATQFQTDGQNLVNALDMASGYAQALEVTENRLFSANQQLDLTSFNAQNNALNQYAAALANAEATEATTATAFAQDLSANGLDMTVTPTQYQAFQSSLKSQGFAALPAQEQAEIQAYFPDAANQQAIVSALAEAPVPSGPTSLSTSLEGVASTAGTIANTLTLPPITDTTVPPLPPGSTVMLAQGQSFSTYAPNLAVIGAGNNMVFLGGTGQTFSGNGNAVLVVNASSTVWTDGGTYSSEGISGTGNAVGLGASIDLVWDNSGGGNSIIPRAGDITLIGGPGIQNDSLNLSNILGATQWDGSGSTLMDYLHIVPTGASEWPAAIGYSTTPNGSFQLSAFVENMTPQQVAAHVGIT